MRMDFAIIVLVAVVGISIFLYVKTHRCCKGEACGAKVPVYVLVGAPGSGKGTLAEKLVADKLFAHVATGNMFRHHIAQQTELGKRVSELYKAGALIPDEIVIAMVREALTGAAQEKKPAILLDGFPRTHAQVDVLAALSKEPEFAHFDFKVVHINVPSADMLLDRLTSRVICSKPECQATYSLHGMTDQEKTEMICKKCGGTLTKRSDDEVEAIKKRIETYVKTEAELLKGFDQAKVPVIVLDGTKSIGDVYNEFAQKSEQK